MSKSVRLIDNLAEWLLIATIAATPLLFLPITQDFYDTNKWLFLTLAAFILIILWSIRTILTNNATFSSSRTGLALTILSAAGLLSLIFMAANKVESLVSSFGFITLLVLTIVFFIGRTFISPHKKDWLLWSLLFSSALVGLVAIYQVLGFGKALFPGTFVASATWTTVGTLVGLASLTILMLPLAVSTLVREISHKKEPSAVVAIILTLTLSAGLFISLINLLPNLTNNFLPLPAAWAITLEEFKNPGNALLGVGSGNYLNAFTIGRPVGLNAGHLWNIRFIVGPSLLFEMTTTLGVFGLLGLLLLIRSIVSSIKNQADWGLKLSLAVSIILILFVPPNFSVIVAMAGLLILAESRNPQHFSFRFPTKTWAILASGTLILLSLASLYPLGRYYGGELIYYQSLVARQKNDGTGTYNRQIQAIQLDPAISNYHLNLSQTSLALASSIITSAGTGTTSAALSDGDRTLATQLISQAITEGKNATSIAPKSVVTWQSLAGVYEAITKVAAGADQWAIAAYQQAIQLDPSNPVLRVSLGGVYLALNQLDNAANEFQFATLLKPDFANAHYNLAYTYRQQQKYLNAAAELTATKSLVQSGSDDDKKVSSELAEVRKRLSKDELNFLDKQYTGSLSGPGTGGIVSPISLPSTTFQGLGPLPISTGSALTASQSATPSGK